MAYLVAIILFLVGGFMVLAAFSAQAMGRYDLRETLGDIASKFIFHGIMMLLGIGLFALAFWIVPAEPTYERATEGVEGGSGFLVSEWLRDHFDGVDGRQRIVL